MEQLSDTELALRTVSWKAHSTLCRNEQKISLGKNLFLALGKVHVLCGLCIQRSTRRQQGIP